MTTGHATRWWHTVTSYPCPVCGAGPGQPCVTYTGHTKNEPHADRSRLASAHGWRDPDDLGWSPDPKRHADMHAAKKP